ncbi:MAG: BREX-1 system adenine-specific DNA-methyltransferase PglX [Gammaproteobacteria bacterium]|jgi:hypothetical protein|nr:BREX-1 system adenine-specific DNA-methyltransferase PglX [Gammaproteobacteria bacterium]
MRRRRVDLKAILADEDLRRDLMVSTIQTTQAREGIETSKEQADRAYYVVNEADKATFLDLERFRGGKRSEPDRREEMFVRTLNETAERVRFDVARRDFGTIETSPLAYRRVGLVSHIFREALSLDPAWGAAKQGLATAADPRFVRQYWEFPTERIGKGLDWIPFAKGGDFSRFYSDVSLLVQWTDTAIDVMKSIGRVQNVDYYFIPGLTWPRRTQRGFNLRTMPAGCIFGDKGPAIFPAREQDAGFLLGIANSAPAEYLLKGLMSFGSWEVGVIKRLPVPDPVQTQHESIGTVAKQIHNAKASWDEGNEISTRFKQPWFLLGDLGALAVPQRLSYLADLEATEEARIQHLYAKLNDEVYKLYGIPDPTRATIEETLGERPPEILWPQMEGKTTEQKRMEHVWRLLSYAVKRVIEADEDGIVPFLSVGGEPPLLDRVRRELAALFPDQDSNQVEVDIANELKRKVKGYRTVQGIGEWLEHVYFDYHASLYKKRPILWHIASSQGRGACAFAALVHYHKLDHDRLAKLRGSYLSDAIAHLRREAGLAAQEGRAEDRQDWQAKLEEAQALDRRLQWVQEGVNGDPAPGDCRIRTPWKSEDELPVGWRPDLDDGVAVNILPLQTAGVLRVGRVI